jgi:hypothetical protein
MTPFTFSCPSCQSVLKSAGQAEPGKKIKCPKCAVVFQLPSASPSGVRVPDRERREESRFQQDRDEDFDDEAPRKRRRRYEEDDYEEDRPKRRRRRKKAASSSLVMWFVLGGVGLAVLVGGGLAFVWLLGGFTQSRLVGRWTIDNHFAQGAITYEFRRDGTFTITSNFIGNTEIGGTYSVTGNTLTMVPNNVQSQGRNLPPAQVGQMQVQIESVDATQIVLSGPGIFGQQRTVLKRVP